MLWETSRDYPVSHTDRRDAYVSRFTSFIYKILFMGKSRNVHICAPLYLLDIICTYWHRIQTWDTTAWNLSHEIFRGLSHCNWPELGIKLVATQLLSSVIRQDTFPPSKNHSWGWESTDFLRILPSHLDDQLLSPQLCFTYGDRHVFSSRCGRVKRSSNQCLSVTFSFTFTVMCTHTCIYIYTLDILVTLWYIFTYTYVYVYIYMKL